MKKYFLLFIYMISINTQAFSLFPIGALALGIKVCDLKEDCVFYPYREQALVGDYYSRIQGGNYTCHVTAKYLPNDIRIVTQIHTGGYYRYTDYFDLKNENLGGQDIDRSFIGSWANDGFFLFQVVPHWFGDNNPYPQTEVTINCKKK